MKNDNEKTLDDLFNEDVLTDNSIPEFISIYLKNLNNLLRKYNPTARPFEYSFKRRRINNDIELTCELTQEKDVLVSVWGLHTMGNFKTYGEEIYERQINNFISMLINYSLFYKSDIGATKSIQDIITTIKL